MTPGRPRPLRTSSKSRWALLLTGVAVAVAVLPGLAGGAQTTGGPAFSFYNVRSVADGVTADFNLEGFLPIEELVGISSVTSEAGLGLGGSNALAALPDPGDLVLTLPGTLSALGGVSGIPDYPAAAFAEHPARPEDEVVFAPDAGIGAGRLRAIAEQDGSSASAAVTELVDTVGLLPSFTVGSIRTTAATRRISGTTFESTATTTINDLRLLGGLLRIDEVTSSVTASVTNGIFGASASDIDVAGATLAGTPVGITEEGIVGLGQPQALAPVVDTLAAPLADQGIRIHTTPSATSISDRRADATGGTLVVDVPVAGDYPGRLVITFGRATSALEAAGSSGTGGGLLDGGTGGDRPSTIAPGGAAGGGSAPAARSSTPGAAGAVSAAPTATGATGTAAGSGEQTVTLPGSRTIANWQVDDLYKAIAAAGIAFFVAGRAVRRLARPAPAGSSLRHLWRW